MRRIALGLFTLAMTARADGLVDADSFVGLPEDPNDPRRVQLRSIIDAEEMARYGRTRPVGTTNMTLTANGDHILVTFTAADGSVTGQRQINRGGAGSRGLATTGSIVPLGHSATGGAPILAAPGPDTANGSSIRVSGYQRVQFPADAVGPDAQVRFSSGTSLRVPTVRQSKLDAVLPMLGTGATFGVVDAANEVRFYRKSAGSLTLLYPAEVKLF